MIHFITWLKGEMMSKLHEFGSVKLLFQLFLFFLITKTYFKINLLHVCVCLISTWTPMGWIIVLVFSSLLYMSSLSLNTLRSQLVALSTVSLDSRQSASTQPWEGQQILLYRSFQRAIMWNYLFASWSLTLMKMSLGPHHLTMLFARSLMWNCLSASCKNMLQKQTQCSNPWRLYVQLFCWFYILCRLLIIVITIVIAFLVSLAITCCWWDIKHFFLPHWYTVVIYQILQNWCCISIQ